MYPKIFLFIFCITCSFLFGACKKDKKQLANPNPVPAYHVTRLSDDIGNVLMYKYDLNTFKQIRYVGQGIDTLVLHEWEYSGNRVMKTYHSNVDLLSDYFLNAAGFPDYCHIRLKNLSTRGSVYYDYDAQNNLIASVSFDSVNNSKGTMILQWENGDLQNLLSYTKYASGQTVDSIYCQFRYLPLPNKLGFIGNPVLGADFYLFQAPVHLLKQIFVNGALGYDYQYSFDSLQNPMNRSNLKSMGTERFIFESYLLK